MTTTDGHSICWGRVESVMHEHVYVGHSVDVRWVRQADRVPCSPFFSNGNVTSNERRKVCCASDGKTSQNRNEGTHTEEGARAHTATPSFGHYHHRRQHVRCWHLSFEMCILCLSYFAHIENGFCKRQLNSDSSSSQTLLIGLQR